MAASQPLSNTFAATQRLSDQSPAFVGRTRELAQLTDALFASPVPPGPVRLITGSPGIGKTRLAFELSSIARREHVQVVWGYCSDDAGAPPFWPWTQVIRQVLGRNRGTNLAELMLEEPADADRFELFDAVAAGLKKATEHGRLLVVLDDLHEADPPTLLLTRFIARQLQDSPLLIVATMWPAQGNSGDGSGDGDGDGGRGDADANGDGDDRVDAKAFAEHVESLCRLGHEIQLNGLDVEEVSQMIDDEEHGSAVHTVTAGNPLYVEQVIRRTSARSSLSLAGKRRSVDTIEGLRQAVRSRIAELGPPELEVLQAAATLGLRPFSDDLVTLIRATFETSGSSIDALIEGLLTSGMLTRSPVGGVEFSHPLIADVASTTIPAALGETLHGNAADLMNQDETRLSEHANHLLQAGSARRDDAVTACLGAARAATRALAHEDGAAHYIGALHALKGTEGREAERLDILMLLGESLWRSGRTDEATDVFEHGWQVATSLGDSESLARAALRSGLEYYFVESAHPVWHERVETALGQQPDGDSPWRVKLLAQMATHHLSPTGEHDARALARESLEMARRVGDPLALGYALVATQVSDLGPETLQQRISGANEILACARESGHYRLSLHGRFLLMGALLESGDVRAIDAELATQYDTVEALGEPRFTRFVLWFRAMRALLDGHPEAAEELAEQCLAISDSIGDPDGLAVYGGQLGIARWMQGRIGEVEDLFLDLRAAEPDEPLWKAVMAWLWAGQGQLAAARGAMADIPDVAVIPRSLNWLVTMTAMADAAASAGDIDQVSTIWSELLPYANRVVPVGIGAASWGTVARPLGRLALRLGNVEEGLSHLTSAIDICARLGARPWLIEAQLELAQALLINKPSDPRIQALIAEAKDGATHLDLNLFIERAAVLEAEAAATLEGRPDLATVQSTAVQPTAVDHGLDEPAGKPSTGVLGRPIVNVMGTFEVFTAEGQAAKWTSRKARELLKILVARRGVPIVRESLMDLLWPDEDPARLGNRLSVAMSTVRRALDPDRLFSADDLLSAASDTVVLRPDVVEIDVERFLERSEQIIDAARGTEVALEAAYSLMRSCRGEALPDEPHADWAVALRDEVRARYVALARLVSEGARRTGDHMRAGEAYRRILDVDPYDEPAHLGLVGAFRAMSAHGQADTTYAVYASRMEELGVPARPESDPTPD